MGEELHFPGKKELASFNSFRGDPVFALPVTAIYAALTLVLILRHQLWIDEAYYFLVVRDAGGLSSIVTTYNGHPHLWSLALYLLKFISPGILAMQLLHSFIAVATVYLLARYCTLTRVERFLVIFGYYFVFEYNVIAKNYIVGFFFLFLATVLFQKRKSLTAIALCLGFAGNSHLFTLLVCVFFFVYVYRDYLKAGGQGRMPALILFSLFIVLAVFQIIPSQKVLETYVGYGGSSIYCLDRLGRVLAAPAKGLFNLPDFGSGSFWNSNYIFMRSRWTTYFLSLFLLGYIVWCFRKQRDLVLLYLGPLSLIMVFIYFAPLATGVRYWGFFYVMLIVCAWLFKLKGPASADLSYLIKSVTILQALVVIPVAAVVYHRPFSNSKNTAESIRELKLGRSRLFVRAPASGPSLSAYAGQKVYYPSEKRFDSYSFDVKRNNLSDSEFLNESLRGLQAMGLDSCVLITNKPIPDSDIVDLQAGVHVSPVCTHTGAIVTSEDYFVYLLTTGSGYIIAGKKSAPAR